MITLYGANASPFVRKAMAVLAIKKLPYEHVPSMPFSGDEELAGFEDRHVWQPPFGHYDREYTESGEGDR